MIQSLTLFLLSSVSATSLVMTIETPRLLLLAATNEHVLALIESTECYEACVGYPPAPGLREFFTGEEVSEEWLEQLRNAVPSSGSWVEGFAPVHRERGLVIGTIGFKGPPSEEGTVEIAYGVVPDFESQGYATEAVRGVLGYVSTVESVKKVIAHTLRERNASPRVLEKNGFTFVGDVIDPEDGPVWRWECDAAGQAEDA